MSAPRKLPPDLVLRGLRNQNLTLEEIGARYNVSPSGVHKALERAGEIVPRLRYHDLLPWRILPVHQTTAMMDRFRHIARQLNGELLEPAQEKRLEKWLAFLDRERIVVDYSPEASPNQASKKVGGFFYVDRAPEDLWIVRQATAKELDRLLSSGTSEPSELDRLRFPPRQGREPEQSAQLSAAHRRIAELEHELRKAVKAQRGLEAIATHLISEGRSHLMDDLPIAPR